MPTFVYTGKSSTGKMVKGEITAPDITQANALIRRQNVTPSNVSPKKSLIARLNAIKIPGLGKKIKTKDITVFTRQFATMIEAGLPLVQCLEILSNQQENPEFQEIILDVKKHVEGGATFAESLARHPKVFDELFVNLIAAGEVGGILDTILNRLSSFLEKAEQLKGKIKGALSYPIIVIIIACLVVAGLMLWVVPIFEQMFMDFGKALPVPTQIVVSASQFMQNYWYLIIIGIMATAFTIKRVYATKRGRKIIDTMLLKTPVLGDLLRKTAVARFTRTLGTMISSGVPILEALSLVAKTTGNVVLEEAVMKARTSLTEGKTLAEPLAESKVFPVMVTQMIEVGESSGALDTMLAKVADFYEDEVDVAVDSLTSMIEPLLMVFLGVVVGGLVVALYLPIFQLAGVASG